MEMPHPAEAALQKYRLSGEGYAGREALLHAFEQIVRVDFLLAAGVLVRQSGGGSSRLWRLFLQGRLSLGSWCELLRASMEPGAPADWLRPCERWVRAQLKTFDAIVQLRNRSQHGRDRLDETFITRATAEFSARFDECLRARQPLPAFRLDEAGGLRVIAAGGEYAAGPFLRVGVNAEGAVVALCDGVKHGSLKFDSGSELARGDLDLCQEISVRADDQHVLDAERASSVLLYNRCSRSTRTTLDRLAKDEPHHRTRIRRKGIAANVEAFLASQLCLLWLDGPGGSGKTTALCQLAEERLAAHRAVLFVPAGGLHRDGRFPDALGEALDMAGRLEAAFDKLGVESNDGQFLILLDGVAAESQLLALLRWAEHQSADGVVRVVASVRTDFLHTFRNARRQPWDDRRVDGCRMPVLQLPEILELAGSLPAEPGQVGAELREQRRELARKIFTFGGTASRRPALALAVLELAFPGAELPEASAARIYKEYLERQVVEIEADCQFTPGKSAFRTRYPGRGRLLRVLAGEMARQGTLTLSVSTGDVGDAGLFQGASRSEDYESLLTNGTLTEAQAEPDSVCSDTLVRFTDPGLFEYIAAGNLSLDQPGIVMEELEALRGRLPSALAIAAHYLIRLHAHQGGPACAQSLGGPAFALDALWLEVAALDGNTFLALFLGSLIERFEWSLDLIDRLTYIGTLGEARLAARAARLLADAVAEQPERLARVRCARARSLYELDAYDQAIAELECIPETRPASVWVQLGEVLATKGGKADLQRAAHYYARALPERVEKKPLEAAVALRGRGYVLGCLDEHDSARECLFKAIEILEPGGDRRTLAEAWSDLAQVYTKQGRFGQACRCLRTSRKVNKQAGFLMGIGIVEGCLGEMYLRAAKPTKAARHLEASMVIAEQVGNRWREAWTLNLQSQLAGGMGQLQEAARLLDRAEVIRRSLNVASL